MRNKIIACVLCGILAIFVVFLRIRFVSMPRLSAAAKAETYKQVRGKISKSINEKYAEFPQQKKDELTKRAYTRYVKDNQYVIKEKIRANRNKKRAFFRNDNGYPYFFGIDSYYWLRLIDNLINKGHIGDRVVGGRQYDDLVDMYIEDSFSHSLHIIMGKVIYDVFAFLGKDVDYEGGLFIIPLFFSVLMVITTFSVTRLLCRSNSAAFFSSLAVNLSPLLLHRTMGEWLDTDIYNVFFPLLIFSSFLFVFKSQSTKRKVVGTIGFAVSCALFASVWQGWWFIFDMLILCGGAFLLNDYYAERRDSASFKNNMLWLVLLFASGCLFVGILNGRESLLSFFFEPGKLIFALKDVPHDNWPNVFLTVAELKKVSAYRIAHELGGALIFFITIIGSIYLILVKKVMRDRELGIGFFCLFIWLGLMYYVSLTAIRFALLLIVPLGIMFGIVFHRMVVGIFNYSRMFSRKIRFLIVGLLIVVAYHIISFYVTTSIGIASIRLPMMNDAWQKSLQFIREDSDDRAIINSWWDYGHWYTAIAKRRVLFDGKTQNSPVAYWVARALLTDNEDEALGILRMLDISKNKAFDFLRASGVGHVRSIEILHRIALFQEEEAREYLSDILAPDAIDTFMTLVYSDDIPQAYFIVSYDMLGKLGAISLIGNWNFVKGDIWIAFKEKRPLAFMNYLMREHNYTEEEAKRVFDEVVFLKDKEAPGWISKVRGLAVEAVSKKFKKDGSLLFFDNGVVLDLKTYNAHIMRGANKGIGIPYSVIYMKGDVLEEKILEGSTMPYSLLFIADEKNNYYKAIFMDKILAQSMFSRMYFLGGRGLHNFVKVREEKTLEGNSVYVYKLKWPQQ